ncbi:hypothetical protein [Thermoactinospora rubra]|uniref:hypothetical protein n=1 Tax=Thermoactinospora rubra TaxID=1088767 RepID=UPI000A1142C6|nr:hypothetical protein [Thermoactinospora rubra]
MSGEQPKFELSVPQVAGGALAAVTAAVAASYLGVTGTVIGAAVASVASTVGGAVYTHYLQRTGEKVRRHTPIPWRRREQEPPRHQDGEGELATAVHATVRRPEQEAATLVMAPVETRRPLPWLKLALATVLIFTISMGGILGYQAAANRTVHEAVTGKAPTREQGPAPADDDRRDEREDRPAGTPATTRSEPTPSATPSAKPSAEPKATTPAPKPSATGRPTDGPTGAPTAVPTPTPSQEVPEEPESSEPPPDTGDAQQAEPAQ